MNWPIAPVEFNKFRGAQSGEDWRRAEPSQRTDFMPSERCRSIPDSRLRAAPGHVGTDIGGAARSLSHGCKPDQTH